MENADELPRAYFEKSEEDSLPRVICDYIAGMTDHFILEQYEKFCGGKPCSIPTAE
jgi:dGTPase